MKSPIMSDNPQLTFYGGYTKLIMSNSIEHYH